MSTSTRLYNLLPQIQYYLCFVILIVFSYTLNAQWTPTEGRTIFHEDFGGNEPTDPECKPEGIPQVIGLTYNCNPAGAGRYAIRKFGYHHGQWWYWGTEMDDTTNPNDTTRGYLMQVDGNDNTAGQFYECQIDDLCSGFDLNMSFQGMSSCKAQGSFDPPNLTMRIETLSGTLLAFQNVTMENYLGAWRKFDMDFNIPDGQTSIVFRIMNNSTASMGNDFAIDDIKVSLRVPTVTLNISSQGVCLGDNVTINATMLNNNFFTPPVLYRWLYSAIDDGNYNDWTVVSTTTTLNIYNFSANNEGYYCMIAANQSNLWSENCRSMSNVIHLQLGVCDLICVDDYYDCFQNNNVVMSPLNNDTIPDACTPTVRIVTPPVHGSAVNIVGTTQYTYTPDSDYIGPDSLRYSVTCGTSVGYAWIYIDVIPFPDNIIDVDCFVELEGSTWANPSMYSTNSNNVALYFTPVVGDIDSDGIVEIVTGRWLGDEGNTFVKGITIYRGNNLSEISFINLQNYGNVGIRANSPGCFAIARYPIDNQGHYEGALFVHCSDNKIRAFSKNGQLLRTTNVNTGGPGTISIADFNNDGYPEIYTGNKIYDAATLTLLCSAPAGSMSGLTYRGEIQVNMSFAANVFGDKRLELICANSIFDVNIVSRTNPALNSITLNKTVTKPSGVPSGAQGSVSVADFDRDGLLDVMVLYDPTGWGGGNANTYMYAYNPVNENILFYQHMSVTETSYPLIGDIDGDTNLEIVILSGVSNDPDKLRAYKYVPGATSLTQMWAINHTDASSMTSMTLFDFNQDGSMEIVYRDETQLRIINGSTNPPANLYTYAMYSGTHSEYPIVADVNLDGSADIIVTGSMSNPGWNKIGYGKLHVISRSNEWAPTRNVWNQYMYNVVNVNNDLTIPRYQFSPAYAFVDPENPAIIRYPYNNFLQQATTLDFNGSPFTPVPDLEVILDDYLMEPRCDTVKCTFTIFNHGDNTLNSPFSITAYNGVYRGDVIYTQAFERTVEIDDTVEITMSIPAAAIIVNLPIENYVFAFNDGGTGIAQNGEQQQECDTLNNMMTLPYEELQCLKAVDDYYSTYIENQISFVPTSNDTLNPTCENPIVEILDNPLHGTAQVANDTVVKYIPADNFYGEDSLSYIVTCDDIYDTAWIFIVVAPFHDNVDTIECAQNTLNYSWSFNLQNTSNENYSPYIINLVGDFDNDGNTEILAASDETNIHTLYVLNPDAAGMPRKYAIAIRDNSYVSYENAIAVADVDGDGYAEIFYSAVNGNVYCIGYNAATHNYNSTPRWTKPYSGLNTYYKSPQPIITDYNGDGVPELTVYDRVYNAVNGTLLLDANFASKSWNYGCGAICATNNVAPSMMAVGDLDGDGYPDLAAGNMCYKVIIRNPNGTAGNEMKLLSTVTLSGQTGDGATALADVDLDGKLDVIVTRRSSATLANPLATSANATVFVWNPRESRILNTNNVNFSTNNSQMGPSVPVIADIDGDMYPEICIAMAANVRTYKYVSGNLSAGWTLTAQGSNNYFSGLTVFDFYMDELPEVIVRNATSLKVIDGRRNTEIQSYPISGGNANQYPVVADIDNDGSSEIIVTGSTGNGNRVHIFSSNPKGQWAPGRKVWNSFGYNVVNINEDLTIPQYPFNPSYAFTDPDNNLLIRRPYNAYLSQATTIDRNAKPIVAAADASFTAGQLDNLCDSLIINLSYTNTGSRTLFAPFEISVYKESILKQLLLVKTVNENLEVGSTLHLSINVYAEQWSSYTVFGNLQIVVNSDGNEVAGIAQDGNQQAECNIENNIINLAFTGFNLSYDTLFNDVACSGVPYEENGFNLSGEFISSITQLDTTVYLSTVHNCDSIVRLQLTVYPVYDTALYDTICFGAGYDLNGFNISSNDIPEAGEYNYTLDDIQSVHGCDSIINLELIVHEVYTEDLEADICAGAGYNAYGFVISSDQTQEAGTYEYNLDNLQSINGCDSTVTLTLRVHPVYDEVITASICEGESYLENNFTYTTPAV
ncbi:MAG: FG-GAP-like repeat-containing protein, partial [Bacteroidales bacterium]|nr:FG-GAP-like repeat-containing protein [Bacteroidales bacterium]